MINNGKLVKKYRNGNGLPEFKIEQAGDYLLIHDGTARRGWLSLQFIFVLIGLVMALPGGRRKRDRESS
jgi:hypothetical protein